MKKIIIIIYSLIISGLSFSQPGYFQKYIAEGRALYLQQLPDKDLFIAGKKDSVFILLRTNSSGELLWKKEYTGFYLEPDFGIKFVNNSYFTVILNKKSGTKVSPSFCKFDMNGNIIYERSYEQAMVTEYCSALEVTSDSTYYIVSNYVVDTTKGVFLRKTDHEGNVLWTRFYSLFLGAIPQNGSNMMLDGNFIYIQPKGNNKLLKVGINGELIWTKQYHTGQRSLTKSGSDKIVLGSDGFLEKIDLDGKVFLSKRYSSGTLNSLIENIEGVIIAGTSVQEIVKIDSIGNKLERVNLNFVPYYFTQFQDSTIVSSGEKIYLIKSKPYWNFIYLTYPVGGERFYPQRDDKMRILWNYGGLSNVFLRLYFSSNNGISWKFITDTIKCSDVTYNFTFPYTYSKSCKIRLMTTDEAYECTSNTFIIDSTELGKNDYYDFIDVNKIKMWFSNTGDGSYNPKTEANGLYWPYPPEGVSSTYCDGLVFGGRVSGQIRAGGNSWRKGLQAGVILPNMTADNPNNPRNRVYKIRKDWASLSPGFERDLYEYNYNNWPVDQGAPYEDINNNGIYDPNIDKPKHLGDETCFYVANDLDTSRTLYVFGSNPLGLEFQTTVYAYQRNNVLGDCVFKKYKIINKGGNNIQDFYLGYYSDDDLGANHDDYVGCDTTLYMTYTWNSKNNDELYGVPAPAVAHQFVQTPVISGMPGDSARFGNGWRRGVKNSPLSGHVFYINANNTFKEPSQAIYQGTLELYNNLQGKLWSGNLYIDPKTKKPTNFLLYGDPEAGTGWYEGLGWPGSAPLPNNRYSLISTGPINFAPGDTQEVVIAIFLARGTSNINSVTKLKQGGEYIRGVHNLVISDVPEHKKIPEKFELHNNYPNPFNSITKISYTIPVNGKVRLKIYDILGREIETLIDEQIQAGKYTTDWNAEIFSSGIYFYELSVGEHSNIFRTIKKMVLLK